MSIKFLCSGTPNLISDPRRNRQPRRETGKCLIDRPFPSEPCPRKFDIIRIAWKREREEETSNSSCQTVQKKKKKEAVPNPTRSPSPPYAFPPLLLPARPACFDRPYRSTSLPATRRRAIFGPGMASFLACLCHMSIKSSNATLFADSLPRSCIRSRILLRPDEKRVSMGTKLDKDPHPDIDSDSTRPLTFRAAF